MKTRIAIIAKDAEDLIQKLEAFCNKIPQSSIYGSNALKLPAFKEQTANLEQIAQAWVHTGKADWNITTLSRFPYPHYPMDRRKSFWIAQKKKEFPSLSEIYKSKPLEEHHFLMLDS